MMELSTSKHSVEQMVQPVSDNQTGRSTNNEDCFSESDNTVLLSRRTNIEEYSASEIYWNFIFFSALYSVTHATVDAVLIFVAAELGTNTASISGFVLYIFYTISALTAARPMLHRYGSKRCLFIGLCGLLVYVSSFFVSLMIKDAAIGIFTVGAAIGGCCAGILWTSQGSYFSACATIYSDKMMIGKTKVITKFASIFAIFYLSFETFFKLISTIIYATADADGTNSYWRYIVFGIYTVAALIAVILFQKIVIPLQSNPVENRTSFISDEEKQTDDESSVRTINLPVKGILAVITALRNDKKLRYLMPFQLCFGFASGFFNVYISGELVNDTVGDGYIGFLSALTTFTAASLAWPFSLATNKYKSGIWYVMMFGGVCFLFTGFPLLFADNQTLGNWGFFVPYYMIHGAARGVWESSNKAVIAEGFEEGEKRDAAFGAVYFCSGLAGALGYIIFQFMGRLDLVILNVTISIIAAISYHLSYIEQKRVE